MQERVIEFFNILKHDDQTVDCLLAHPENWIQLLYNRVSQFSPSAAHSQDCIRRFGAHYGRVLHQYDGGAEKGAKIDGAQEKKKVPDTKAGAKEVGDPVAKVAKAKGKMRNQGITGCPLCMSTVYYVLFKKDANRCKGGCGRTHVKDRHFKSTTALREFMAKWVPEGGYTLVENLVKAWEVSG
jgi:hypothetical protein